MTAIKPYLSICLVRLLAACFSLVIGGGYEARRFGERGMGRDMGVRVAREEKQTAVSSHVFEDIQTCQKLIKLTSKRIKIN